MKIHLGVPFLTLCMTGLVPHACAQALQLEWARQIGTTGDDSGFSVSTDALGNVYISGETLGNLGAPNAGGIDAFLGKFDAAGSLQWTRQLGTTGDDRSYGVSADVLGNVFVTGSTRGSLGGPNAGMSDAFVSKYDEGGSLQWTRQLGTANADLSDCVSADSLGNVYISGITDGNLGGSNAGLGDVFVSKYDASGNQQWTRQSGFAGLDWASGISADSQGNVYVSGFTQGDSLSISSFDAFLSKYDSLGNVQWTRKLGTANVDASYGVSANALGDIYITGVTEGSLGGLNAGSGDVFVSKYDASGNLQWTRQLGTAANDSGASVSADSLGNVYVSGSTNGSLVGPNEGKYDVFVIKFDASGVLQWTYQLGTANDDVTGDVSIDSLGNVYISGSTEGSLGGPNFGGRDAFVAKFSPIPEPGTLLLAVLASVALLPPRARRQTARA